jgi:hypothetical protein
MHSTTKMCPFQIVYGLIPQTRDNIEHLNAKNEIAGRKGRKEISFQPGDLVWLHLRKDQFPALHKSKLMPHADGSFTVLEKINDNAYKHNLPKEYGVSPNFNVADLKHYVGEEEQILSRMTSL